jgi:predicted transcriptional regulator
MSDSHAIVEKTVHIPAEMAERLNQIAQAEHISENELITKALDMFFSLADDASLDRRDWTISSEGAFSKVWDNEDDARYDRWREIYGVPAR